MTQTLLQRIQTLSEDKQHEYLDNFPDLLLQEARGGNKLKLEKYLSDNYGFIEAILMLGEVREGFSPTAHLNYIYAEALDLGCSEKVRLINAALRDAISVIEQYPNQLASHLYERLIPYQDGLTLAHSIQSTNSYWLKPLRPNYFTENDNYIVVRHGDRVYELFLTPDKKKIISVGHDYRIRVTQLKNNSASIVLVDPVVSQRSQETQGIYEELSHDWTIVNVAVMPDSQRLYSLSMDGILNLWDLDQWH